MYKPCVVCLVETWLDSSIDDVEISIQGYTIVRRDHSRHGGGILIVSTYHIPCSIIDYTSIRDNHNHYTSLCLLFLIIILMLTHAILGVHVLDLHVGEINLPIHNFRLLLIIKFYDPHATQKASVGMYSGCDYLLSLTRAL